MKLKNILKKTFQKAFGTTTKEVTKSGKRSDSSKAQDFFVSPDILQAFFRSDPVINAATWLTVDNVVPAYDMMPVDDSNEALREVEEAERIFEENNQLDKVRNIAANLVVQSNAYEEQSPYVVQGKQKLQTFVLDTPTIKIKLNKNGEIKSYDQYMNGKKVASLDPEFIVHYRINSFGDSDYGLSVVESVLFSSSMRKFINKYNASIFQNHKPRGLWNFSNEMDVETYNDNVDLIIDAKKHPNKDIFLRGEKGQIGFEAFVQANETSFNDALKDAREEVLIGMRVPPVLMSLIGSSNISDADAQLEGFDMKITAMQQSINKIVTEQILNKQLNLTKVKFVLRRSNKRNEIRELKIVRDMSGLVTLNEARDQLGLHELDEKDFPTANQIWTAQSSSFGSTNQQEGNSDGKKVAENFKKDMSSKKKVESSEVSRSIENKAVALFKNWVKELRVSSIKEISESNVFSKQVDPKVIASSLFAQLGTTGLKDQFVEMIKGQYMNSIDDIGKKLDKNFLPNQEEIKFLEDYNFDLITDLTDKTQSSLRNTLRRGLLEGKNTKQVSDDVMKELDKTEFEAERIARTELNRANSEGSLNAMRDTGLNPKKYILIVEDDRTSNISKAFSKKYGTPEQAIGLEEIFEVRVKGKTYQGKSPPFHPFDRDALAFLLE